MLIEGVFFEATAHEVAELARASARVEALCLRSECPLLARRGEPWAMSGYAAGLPRPTIPWAEINAVKRKVEQTERQARGQAPGPRH